MSVGQEVLWSGSEYAAEKGFKLTPVTPCDPQGNGFVENFVKSLCKLLHTPAAERKDPKPELHRFPLQYRASTHSSTELSPPEMLFGEKSKRSGLSFSPIGNSIKSKVLQKRNNDRRYRVKKKNIITGDKVLVQQQKSTYSPQYDPQPYTVTHVNGNQVHLFREEGKQRVRDTNQLRVVKDHPQHLTPSWQLNKYSSPTTDYALFDIESPIPCTTADSTSSSSHVEPQTRTAVALTLQSNDSVQLDDHQVVLFDISEQDHAKMNRLLEAAQKQNIEHEISLIEDEMKENEKRLTRCSCLQLKWDPQLSANNLVVEVTPKKWSLAFDRHSSHYSNTPLHNMWFSYCLYRSHVHI